MGWTLLGGNMVINACWGGYGMGWIIRGLKYGSAGLLLTYLLYDTCGIKDIIRRSIIHGPDPLI